MCDTDVFNVGWSFSANYNCHFRSVYITVYLMEDLLIARIARPFKGGGGLI